MEEVAHSISLTTITTIFAFLLGLRSDLPGVQWLCLCECSWIGRRNGRFVVFSSSDPQSYQSCTDAFTTITVDFYYQVTLYIAFIVLDERRIQENRRDICWWIIDKKPETLTEEYQQTESNENHTKDDQTDHETGLLANKDKAVRVQSIPERIVSRYADFLLQPSVKGLVLVLFAALLGCCIYSATLLTQEFKVGDFVPQDSYLKDVAFSLVNYASVVRPIAVYFRDVDQTDPAMQEQMVKYVNDLEKLEEVSSIEVNASQSGFDLQVKPFCWVRDVQDMTSIFAERPELSFVQNLTFTQQLDIALANPTIRELYGQDIIRDETGNITTSRCWLFLSDIDLDDVEAQVDFLHKQRAVGAAQPINQGKAKGDWPFFFYDVMLFYWET